MAEGVGVGVGVAMAVGVGMGVYVGVGMGGCGWVGGWGGGDVDWGLIGSFGCFGEFYF